MSTPINPAPAPPPPARAAKPSQCHPDRPERAKGMCAQCYRADLKAKSAAMALERARQTPDERHEVAVVRDLERDPEVKKRFYEIMWKWMDAAEIQPIYKMEGGKKVRDYTTEARMAELNQRKADKAATVLGRAYVVEKREEVKPVPLPLGGEVDTSGWDTGEAEDEDFDETESMEVSGDEE